jgi:hypothetical protein
MLVRVFARGTGGGKGPVDYVISEVVPEFDPETHRRIPGQTKTRTPAPEVLAGDPDRTRMLIDACPNKWRYTSGVIAFERGDIPANVPAGATERAVMASFEEMAFAGLEREQYDILWVRHSHEGNVELHFVVPRMELRTTKALNIAPPGHEKTFDAWRDTWNHSQGWARPDDPQRARLGRQSDHDIKTDAARLRAGLERSSDPKAAITAWLSERIEAGLVQDRAGVVASLAEIGDVTRQGKDYVSVKPAGFDKAIRLKGAIYEQSFQRAELGRDPGREAGAGPEADRGIDQERAGAARRELEAAIERRARFNLERYRVRAERAPDRDQAADRTADRATGREPDGPQERSGRAAGADPPKLDQALGDRPEPLAGHLSRELGTDAVVFQWHPGPTGDTGRPGAANPGAARDAGQDRGQDVGRDIPRGQGRALPGSAARGGTIDWLEQWKEASRQAWEKIREAYDRTREAAGRWIEAIGAAIRAGHEATGGAEHAVATSGAGLGRQGGALDRVLAGSERQADRTVRKLTVGREDELERFKTGINLAEYAESQGYQVDRKESSRASTVMRQGGDKIIVATDQDGHGIYFSVRDGLDHGSIIDFVQRRQGLNIGQARKALRPWLDSPSPSHRPKVERKPEAERARKPEPSTADRQRVLAVWMTLTPAEGRHPYLESERKLSRATLADPRFIGMVRRDARGNAVFPHYDRQGLAGYELKNAGFTGFGKHGTKAIWHSANLASAPRVVIVESAIDAMSHAQVSKDREAAYLSTGGSMSEHQRDLVRGVLAKAAVRGAEVVLATDRDEAGRKLAQEVARLAPAGARLSRLEPANGKDWNDQLRERERARSHGLSR